MLGLSSLLPWFIPLKKVICLKQPKFNALLVFTLLYWKKHYVFSWQKRSFHWTVNGPWKIAKPTEHDSSFWKWAPTGPVTSTWCTKRVLMLHICDCRWLYAADYCDKFYWLQSSSPVVKTCNWPEILICAFAGLCSEFGYFFEAVLESSAKLKEVAIIVEKPLIRTQGFRMSQRNEHTEPHLCSSSVFWSSMNFFDTSSDVIQ